MDSPVEQTAQLLESLLEPVEEVLETALNAEQRAEIIASSHFRPSQDEAIGQWFAKTLSIREELLEIIYRCSQNAGGELKQLKTSDQWRWFILAYVAACALVRIDRYLISVFARHKLIQRKLNQPYPEYRIPAKQYTHVFGHFTDPLLALQLYQAMKFIENNKDSITALREDERVGSFARELDHYQSWLDPSRLNYLKRTWIYIRHAWRRRAASAKQKSFFNVMEHLGKTASELSIHANKQVTPEILQQTAALLKPGDVIVTRHKYALTNLFLPGTWPHTALYVGTRDQHAEFSIEVPADVSAYWENNEATFEALKDGVHLRTLESTLAVDYFVIIRPNLSKPGIKTGIERVLQHRGKRYNFDFDFFRSDRLVCTEVIYRAFDGLENIHIELTERAGRKTLAAEDLLDMALSSEAFSVVALFGYPDHAPELHLTGNLNALLVETYTSSDQLPAGQA